MLVEDDLTATAVGTNYSKDAGNDKRMTISAIVELTDANSNYDISIEDSTGVETSFSPDDNCTRAQIVTFLYRAMAN